MMSFIKHALRFVFGVLVAIIASFEWLVMIGLLVFFGCYWTGVITGDDLAKHPAIVFGTIFVFVFGFYASGRTIRESPHRPTPAGTQSVPQDSWTSSVASDDTRGFSGEADPEGPDGD